MVNAIVFVHPDRLLPSAAICYKYCLALGYTAVGLVRGWDDAISVNRADPDADEVAAEVVVVAHQDELPPDRKPRLEIVALARPEIYFEAVRQFEAAENGEPAPAPAPTRRGKRTRIIRRIAGE